MPANQYLSRGMPGTVPCPVDANPPTLWTVWTRNGQRFDPGSVTQGGEVVISKAGPDNEGMYTCQGYSSIGAGAVSPPVRVLVRGIYRRIVNDDDD